MRSDLDMIGMLLDSSQTSAVTLWMMFTSVSGARAFNLLYVMLGFVLQDKS